MQFLNDKSLENFFITDQHCVLFRHALICLSAIMNGRKFRPAFQLFLLTLITLSIYYYHGTTIAMSTGLPAARETETKPATNSARPLPSGILPSTTVSQYVQAILDPENTQLPKLACPRANLARYDYLKVHGQGLNEVQYFFALNLRQCLPLLPRLIGSIVEAIRFLGPGNCAISVVEGNSADGTNEVLAGLRPELDKLLSIHDSRVHFMLSNGIRPLDGEGLRFKKLAELRNMALQPLLDGPDQHRNATVVFINDVAICLEDILELIHQRHHLKSDMVCAMDWVPGGGGEPIFYDSYISRSINGDLFFNIPPETASYSQANDLFWNEPEARKQFALHEPFQVFSCWNGAVAFRAAPVVEGRVAFRSVFEDRGECFQAEPELFCKDLWFQGHGKIAVFPSVNVAYSNEDGAMVKHKKGYAADLTSRPGYRDEVIEWQPPPAQVKCMPSFTDQTWRPWNESLI